ncbi:hypothetical protein [Oceanotoga teriensis]|jgi:hypothetical protein|uniref:Uncharacterized protein n=1 Tax=Oceanotoga teriensis TaxID=515440 RepID=A0AA45HIP4_9BACT|nr:hypothetical protein [Oceanotoga teriensis]MDO7977222.1 hypothetical protein [Oceanotoga teriensis]PWJ93212.1 hypothetical protein C7380_10841 [Oceanotoga teriensis]
MNKKGIAFLILCAFVLTLTIAFVKGKNHFLQVYDMKGSFEGVYSLSKTMNVEKDTIIFINAYKDENILSVDFKILDINGTIIFQTEGKNEKKDYEELKIPSGEYILNIEGYSEKNASYDFNIGHYTDFVNFNNNNSKFDIFNSNVSFSKFIDLNHEMNVLKDSKILLRKFKSNKESDINLSIVNENGDSIIDSDFNFYSKGNYSIINIPKGNYRINVKGNADEKNFYSFNMIYEKEFVEFDSNQ